MLSLLRACSAAEFQRLTILSLDHITSFVRQATGTVADDLKEKGQQTSTGQTQSRA